MRDWAEAMTRNASWGLKRRRKFTELGGVTGKVLTKKKQEKKQEKKSCLIFYSLCIPATHQPSSPPSVPYFYLSA